MNFFTKSLYSLPIFLVALHTNADPVSASIKQAITINNGTEVSSLDPHKVEGSLRAILFLIFLKGSFIRMWMVR